MVFGSSVVWRYPQQRAEYQICEGLELGDGFLIFSNARHEIQSADYAYYTPRCYSKAPLLSTFSSIGAEHLPFAQEQWRQFTQTETGSFKYSVYPLIYSLTVATVICIFMTIIVFTNHTQRPSWLLRVSSFLGSVNLIILFSRGIVELSRQHDLGYASGEELLDELQDDSVFGSIDFVVVLVAQFAQVQVIMRLFNRVKEKRAGFILGGTLLISAQVIWGVSSFSNFDQTVDSDISILPAFTYLLRIALSMMYCGLIIIYGVGKRRFIFHKDIVLLTILTFLTINFQFAFFVADIADLWVSELSEVFNTTIYISVTVIPWEWINRLHALERRQQTEGILGRPIYEEEYHDITRYGLINDTEENRTTPDDNDQPGGSSNPSPELQNAKGTSPLYSATGKMRKRLRDTLQYTSDTLLYFTDQIIAYGLAVPRSVSANSREEDARKKKLLTNTRKEVFVYSNKEVVCDSDNEMSLESTGRTDYDSPLSLNEGSSRDMDQWRTNSNDS